MKTQLFTYLHPHSHLQRAATPVTLQQRIRTIRNQQLHTLSRRGMVGKERITLLHTRLHSPTS